MTERGTVGGRLERWTLLDGNRLVVAGALTAGVFVLCLALGAAGLISTENFGPLRSMVGAVLGGTLPFITVVLAINQLILSEEFGTTGTFRDRLGETREFRDAVERHADREWISGEPARFLQVLVLVAVERARTVRSVAGRADGTRAGTETETERDGGSGDAAELEGEPTAAVTTPTPTEFAAHDLQADVDRHVGALTDEMTAAAEALETATFGTFEVTSIILDLDDPVYLQRARRIRAAYDLEEETEAAFDDLETILDDIHVARQYFKTVHVQQELANLSRHLLYVGFLALIVGGSLLLADTQLGEFVSSGALSLLLVATVVSVVVTPYTVLFAYVLRIATVARRTAADFGPFLLQQEIPEEERP